MKNGSDNKTGEKVDSLPKTIVQGLAHARQPVAQMERSAANAWTKEGVQLVHTAALGQNCREAARRLLALADKLDACADDAQ